MCLGALLVAYLVVLFGVCELHDIHIASHDATRVLAACVELALVGLLCAGCVRLQRTPGSRWWLVVAALLAGLVGAVYLAQIYALVLSNNFISVLGLENTDSATLVTAPVLGAGAVAWLAWWAWFCVGLAGARRNAAVGVERWSWPAYLAVLTLTLAAVGWLLALQNKNERLEPGFRQAPLVNLAANAYASRFDTDAAFANAALRPREDTCFSDPGADRGSRFPFQKPDAYQSPLPYPRTRTGQPNVIVIFTEGTSTRLLGAYGGHYPGLTPNINRLAARSLQVEDYFNHTAATYRGLIGQLSSGYVYNGGYGRHGWETGNNGTRLGAIRRRTLPLILAGHGYRSYFFSPHLANVPFTAMLDSLGFTDVFTADSIGHDLLGGHYRMHAGTRSLDDASLFSGLVAFLRQRHASDATQPFFIGLYNIGTHAFLPVDAAGARYGDSHNGALNRLHDFDHALGLFLDYFYQSPYADNTILVFTTDHASYPEPDYRAVAGKDLNPYFVDRIPLLIDDPFHRLPRQLDAAGRNSLDLAPTLLQLLGIRATRNSFLGHSLFEPRSFTAGFTALGKRFYLTTPHGIFSADAVPPALQPTFACEAYVVREYYAAEAANRLANAPTQTTRPPATGAP